VGNQFINLVGQAFGSWTVVKRASNNSAGKAVFYCRCECGAARLIRACRLRYGDSVQCGNCAENVFKDMSGQVFSSWKVLRRTANDPTGQARFFCRCECGGTHIVTGTSLRRKKSTQCLSCAAKARHRRRQAPGKIH